MSKFDIYETVTNLIVERLEAGVIPWHMPWKTASAIPRNLVSKQPYRGFNFWYLLNFGFERPYFLTFKQVQDIWEVSNFLIEDYDAVLKFIRTEIQQGKLKL
ncbi:ArdC family protein [Draconibacterium orientale]|uniref:ArdC family protein n=1 Tax=Draconibacterium orientale TaxID=1168034 RepID=UPI002A0A7E93|nr:ArdC family protein [Draconibacterium orientale]